MSGSIAGLRGGLMVCGTTSDAGKSTIVAGLCRLLAREGVSVAPFKAQNMSLNSAVTADGAEIGRAQALQSFAAGVEPEAAMNPVLLKPTGERESQVVVLGRPVATQSAADYHRRKLDLLPTVLGALASLRDRFDVVLCEGAGSPAEINLLDRDIVNLRIAHEAGLPAIVVGDINPGGVYAALYGTVALLPDHLRATVKGLVINKLRGDPGLLLDGNRQLSDLLGGVPVLGVIPWIAGTGLDAEDSLALDRTPEWAGPPIADELDVAVVRFPRISNFTDFDPLLVEPGVAVRYVSSAGALGRPDLIVLPGSKATVADLDWLRQSGLVEAIAASSATVLGICAGYQMLGASIDDGVESGRGAVPGLGWLDVSTRFETDKVTRRRAGQAGGHRVEGYQIHHGRVVANSGDVFVELDGDSGGEIVGVRAGRVAGTTLHGLFERDEFRASYLVDVAARAGKTFVPAGVSVDDVRRSRLDALADVLAEALDIDALAGLIAGAAH
jgi:adenosylcobyric acid synthase